MKPEVKKKWLKALRSGKYEQAQGRLHEDSKFCCLGVLCDLHAKETGRKWKLLEEDTHGGDEEYSYMDEGDLLPKMVMRWAGLRKHATTSGNDVKIKHVADAEPVEDTDNITSLAELNDDGCTFEEIADFIEAQL
jgi:hypothetical protein